MVHITFSHHAFLQLIELECHALSVAGSLYPGSFLGYLTRRGSLHMM